MTKTPDMFLVKDICDLLRPMNVGGMGSGSPEFIALGMDDPRAIGQPRTIKKAVAESFMEHFPPVTRCNGTIYMEPQVYLGWW